MGRVLVAGGTGLIGRALVQELKDRGHEVLVLSRRSGPGRVQWDGCSVGAWAAELDGAKAIVNLAGESIAGRWTEAYKQKIVQSRLDPTRAIGNAIDQCKNPPEAWIQASAIGYYGDTGSREVSEASPAGSGFLADTTRQWEEAADEFDHPKTRLLKVRVGVVLAREGGMLPMLAKLTKAFLGGAVGSGRQYIPWVHLEDIARLFAWGVDTSVCGAVNGTAPSPVTNATFMAELRRVTGRPWVPPAPEAAIRALGPILGVAPELALTSSRVVPAIALAHGFRFRYTELGAVLDSLVGDVPQAWKS